MASRSWNKVELIGNLTRDPEMRYTPTGTAICTFSIATNRTYLTPDGERKEEVDFHRCVAWSKLAELCNQLLKKGNKTFVSGRLQNRSWEGTDGQTRYATEIVIEDMIILTSKSGSDFSGGDFNEDVTPESKPDRTWHGGDVKSEQAPKAKSEETSDGSLEENKTEEKKPKKEEVLDKDLEDLPF